MIQIQESINHYASGIAKRRTIMINLKKHDNVADAVKDILQQEALKGNQDKIDANHNGKIDAQDFKILRGKKKVEEELKGNQDKIDANHNGKIDGEDFKLLRAKKKMKEEIDMNDRTKDTLVGREKTKQKDDVGPNSNAKVSKFKLKSEEAEQIDELSKSTLGSYIKKSSYDATERAASEPVGDIAADDEAKKEKRLSGIGKAVTRLTKEEQIDEKNWIANAIKHPGAETAAAKKAGMSTQAYAEKHKHDSGKAGKRARLALTLKHMKEKFEEPVLDELINEVMAKDASAGDYIHDFIHSDNPKFAGKSKAKRKEMALAAYYSKKNEEAVNEGLKDVAKKAFTALTGGSDKDHLDRLKKDMYGGSEVKYAAKTLVKHAKDPLGLKKEEVEQIDEKNVPTSPEKWAKAKSAAKSKFAVYPSAYANGWASKKYKSMGGGWKAEEVEHVEEGWDDMVKSAQEKVKSGPKPNGGSGKKEGSAYGGSKQKEKPEHEMKEAKNPMKDAGVGAEPNFSTDATKPMKVAQSMAKKSLSRMRSEMLGKTGTSE